MREATKAATLMHELAEQAQFHVSCRPPRAPGRVIQRLPEEKRKILRGLRSDDIADFRVPDYW